MRISLIRWITLLTGFAVVAAISGCSSSGSSTGGSGASGSPTVAATKSPIAIGSVTALSGVASSSNSPVATGLQAWVKYTNAHGGILGHPVNLTVEDSQSVPADEAAAVQKVVQQVNPVALVGIGAISVGSWKSFVTSRHLPVIGGTNDDPAWNTTAGFFTQLPSFGAGIYALGTVRPSQRKFGVAYCEEAPTCTAADQLLTSGGLAKANGAQVVFNQKITLGQADYTAMCLSAKTAGVQTLDLGADVLTVGTIAQDCSQQGFKPAYTLPSEEATASLASNPALDGTISFMGVAPWYLNTPGTNAFRSAINQYYPGQVLGSVLEDGWVAGEVFGSAATAALTANPNSPLTSAELTTALGQMSDAIVNGMTVPLTYSASKPNPPLYCYYLMAVSNGKWTAFNGQTSPVCIPEAARSLVNN